MEPRIPNGRGAGLKIRPSVGSSPTAATQAMFSSAWPGDGGWFRLFGLGLSIQDRSIHPAMFSERVGLRKSLRIGKWSVTWLRRSLGAVRSGGATSAGLAGLVSSVEVVSLNGGI